MAWDRYAYSLNNPIKYNDPFGHSPDILLDIAFIAMDIYFIQTEGWTPNNAAALCADLVLAVIPVGTGGGPAIQTLSRGPKAAVAVYTQAAVHIPEWVRAGQAGEKLLQSINGSIAFFDTSCPGCGSENLELLRSKGGIANNQHIKDLSNIGKDGISAWCSTCRANDLSGKFWGRTAEEIKAFANELGLDPNKAVVYTPEFGGVGHYSLFIDAFGKDGKLLPEYADRIDQFLRNGVNHVK